MGGSSYNIAGTPERRLWEGAQPVQAPAPPPSFWRRLLGESSRIQQSPLPRLTTSRNGDRSFELSPGALPELLIPDLRKWIASRVPVPSPGSTIVFEYLRDISPSVFVRGLQRANQRNPEFWVQIGFSGCAGEAETSARVATHWTALWHQAEARRIAEQCLIRFGFAPEPYTSDETEPMCFLPAGELGYLEYIPSERRSKWQPAFEVDNAVAEAWPGDPVLEQLEGSFGKYMTESRCRCQLCEPAFPGAVIG